MQEIFSSLLLQMIAERIPDLHFVSGLCGYMRKQNGEIEILQDKGVFTIEDLREFLSVIKPELKNEEFYERDFSFSFGGGRFRVNAFLDSKGLSIAIRSLYSTIPTLEEVGLGGNMKEMLARGKGLVLVTGPTGSGKSTTLAAMIDYINQNSKRHIITIEDPIEFYFEGKKSLVNQREIGTHSESFGNAIRSSLRQDPDVIMVGEMRDLETISAVLTLAETGHLVFSTLHTNDTVQSIDRIIDAFPAGQQDQVRSQLAMSLTCVMSQVLVPKKEGDGRVVAREVLLNTDPVRSLILQGNTHQLYGMIELSQKDGMILMDKYLERLFLKNIINKEVLMSHLRDKSLFTDLTAPNA